MKNLFLLSTLAGISCAMAADNDELSRQATDPTASLMALNFQSTYIGGYHGATPPGQADDGSGHYVPGSMATLIDLPPTKPGWVLESAYLHYEGDVSATRTISISGLTVANLNATSDAFMLGGFPH